MWDTIYIGYCIITLSALASAVNYPQPTCYEKTTRFPPCIDKYAVMPGHLNCRFPYTGILAIASDEAEIVHIHNRLRASVLLTAGNMMQLEYTRGLQHTAQLWTRLCSTQSSWFERATPGAFIPGQNTYISPTQVLWNDVLNAWMAESASFTYNGTANNNDRVGNYTQMISGPTTGLGCAVSDCHGYFLYMCLYVPILNPADIDTPYKVAKQPCSDCPAHCNTTANLCNCNGVTCLGGSTLNLDTCSCDCIKTMGAPDIYSGNLCDLSCSDPLGDDPACGKPPYTNDSCDTNMATMFHCPYMCYVCPYADYSYPGGLLPWEKGLPNCTTTTVIKKTTTTVITKTTTKALSGVGKSSTSMTTAALSTTGSSNYDNSPWQKELPKSTATTVTTKTTTRALASVRKSSTSMTTAALSTTGSRYYDSTPWEKGLPNSTTTTVITKTTTEAQADVGRSSNSMATNAVSTTGSSNYDNNSATGIIQCGLLSTVCFALVFGFSWMLNA